MRIKTDRTNQILEVLTREKKIEVADLAEKIGVSRVTIRKDLDELEKKGIIQRERGYALLKSENDLNNRIAYHYEQKQVIARRAVDFIRDGDTLMIENGSCCALLAEALAQTRKNLTIITNSAFIADYIRGSSGFQILLLGGIYQQDSQVMVGPLVNDCVKNFYVDYFFIGTDGYSSRRGFTNRDQLRAQAVRDMARQAEHVIILTESEKFERKGVVPLNLGSQITAVVTDDRLPDPVKADLESMHIQVLIA